MAQVAGQNIPPERIGQRNAGYDEQGVARHAPRCLQDGNDAGRPQQELCCVQFVNLSHAIHQLRLMRCDIPAGRHGHGDEHDVPQEYPYGLRFRIDPILAQRRTPHKDQGQDDPQMYGADHHGVGGIQPRRSAQLKHAEHRSKNQKERTQFFSFKGRHGPSPVKLMLAPPLA